MKTTRLALLAIAFVLISCSEEASEPGGVAMAGSGAPPAAACSGKPGALRGKSMQMLMAAGLNRSFIYYAPPTLDPNTPAPVVIVPHGYTMSADMMFEITKYSELADRDKFVVLFPNGQAPGMAPPWNVGQPDCTSTLGILPIATGDDNAFVDAMLAFAEADQCLDKGHVFMSGFSMGGYLTNHLGCMRPDLRGIGPHSGGSHDFSTCKVTTKPVILMHFEGDALIPYMCGTAARDRWIALNKCQSAAPDVTPVQGGRCEYYKGCAPGGQVAMCSFANPMGARTEPFAGHAWSGGSKDGMAGGAPFAIPETASASVLGWEFFKKYAW